MRAAAADTVVAAQRRALNNYRKKTKSVVVRFYPGEADEAMYAWRKSKENTNPPPKSGAGSIDLHPCKTHARRPWEQDGRLNARFVEPNRNRAFRAPRRLKRPPLFRLRDFLCATIPFRLFRHDDTLQAIVPDRRYAL